ncbi:MAG: insulinase family protein [SAR324 cluster bacterium]|uniref:Insulinase family protein n=1 Tax=SAR324 cluster bacterium TaxID=2024889 RepID=A0A7X9FQN9_9DELT|nr:insulinase family protein [SAR324 cluster bacterium]
MEADFLRYPVMRQFYQERDVVREEQRSRTEDDPMGRLLEQFYGTAFLMHPYRQPVIGYVSDIERLTATKLETFRDKYYVPSNMVITLVGDVDPERDGILLEKYFGEIPKGKDPERPKIEEREQDGERRITVQFNSSPELLIGYKKPNYPHPDDAPITVMLEVLSGGKTSLLYRELVEKKRLATVVEVTEVPGSAYPNLAVFFAEPANPHSNDKLLEEFDRLIDEFKESQVNEEDIKIAKRALSMSYLQTMRSNNSLASALLSSELLHGDWMATLAWYDEAMKVSSNDIKRVANTYLRKSRRTIGMLEKKMEVEK